MSGREQRLAELIKHVPQVAPEEAHRLVQGSATLLSAGRACPTCWRGHQGRERGARGWAEIARRGLGLAGLDRGFAGSGETQGQSRLFLYGR